tara:strand:+ start:9324 stop:9674 length:351 start_codon:yes stop_codon:yes gene_type:complete
MRNKVEFKRYCYHNPTITEVAKEPVLKADRKKAWGEVRAEPVIGNIQDPHIRRNLYHLISEVIRGGMREHGQSFFKSDVAKWWIAISNLNYDYLYRKYKEYRIGMKDTATRGKGRY